MDAFATWVKSLSLVGQAAVALCAAGGICSAGGVLIGRLGGDPGKVFVSLLYGCGLCGVAVILAFMAQAGI